MQEKKLDQIASRLKEKQFTIPTDLVGAILFFALGAFLFLIMPEQVSVSESDVVNGRVFPRLLFLLMMICSFCLLYTSGLRVCPYQCFHGFHKILFCACGV